MEETMRDFIEEVVGVAFLFLWFTILFSGLFEQFMLGVIETLS
tara:strand:+ start:503 stop:631 length:129 start_codon:yes stop_codon:yes gene_type:complete